MIALRLCICYTHTFLPIHLNLTSFQLQSRAVMSRAGVCVRGMVVWLAANNVCARRRSIVIHFALTLFALNVLRVILHPAARTGPVICIWLRTRWHSNVNEERRRFGDWEKFVKRAVGQIGDQYSMP